MAVTVSDVLDFIDSMVPGGEFGTMQDRRRAKADPVALRVIEACGLTGDIEFENLTVGRQFAVAATMVSALIGRQPESTLKEMYSVLVRLGPLYTSQELRSLAVPEHWPGLPRLKFIDFHLSRTFKPGFTGDAFKAYSSAGSWFERARTEFFAPMNPNSRSFQPGFKVGRSVDRSYRRYFGDPSTDRTNAVVSTLKAMCDNFFNTGLDIRVAYRDEAGCIGARYWTERWSQPSLSFASPPIYLYSGFFKCLPVQQVVLLIGGLSSSWFLTENYALDEADCAALARGSDREFARMNAASYGYFMRDAFGPLSRPRSLRYRFTLGHRFRRRTKK